MSSMIRLYRPTAPRFSESRLQRRTLPSLQGKVVGFIDNTKPNFARSEEHTSELQSH